MPRAPPVTIAAWPASVGFMVFDPKIDRASALQIAECGIDCPAQLPVASRHRKLRELADDVFRRAEKYAAISLVQHRGVVVAVAGCDDLEVELLKPLHRLALLVRHAQPVVD